jgi:2-polyprenyl-3-methyl-5-hydroxy-6-metoxy-1,4-benzoquinol methylase
LRHLGTKTGRFVKSNFDFYACQRCSFQFVEPVTDFTIYNDAYYAGRGPDVSVDYERERRDDFDSPRVLEFQDLLRIARNHLDRSPHHNSVEWLDFGCGTGGLLSFLSNNARELAGPDAVLNVTGYDVGSYVTRLSGSDAFQVVDLEALNSMTAWFDVISCIEVLEHLPEPRPVLQLLSRLLKPGGLLILTTGNMQSPIAKFRGLSFGYCVPEIHVSLFNPALLESLYREAGLSPLHVKFRGTVQFRIVKKLRLYAVTRIFAPLAQLSPFIAMADFLYGTSAMPCAVKQ